MPRFVILSHSPGPNSSRSQHWDLMLEEGETLLTWALHGEPVFDCDLRAEPLVPHRRAYLEYEGEVSGGRGRVRRWDHGEYVWEERTDEALTVRLLGGVIRGQLSLTRTGFDPQGWIARFSTSTSPDDDRKASR